MSSTSIAPYVVAFTAGKVFCGELGGSMTLAGTIGLSGADPVACVAIDPSDGKSKVLAVDSSDSLLIDPVAGTVKYWGLRVSQVGAGTLPTRCALVAMFRGRAVLARQENNASIWYMSRVGNIFDFDFGAAPLSTSAIAGTDPTIGQPGDAITALITYKDDYLLFGCRGSLYWMVGDPGYGGTVQIVSNQVGVLSPKSWCFDESGVLYFLSPGGLYRWVPGGVPEPLAARRLHDIIERVTTDDVKVEMAYDAFKRQVLITFSPLDGSAGTHVLYDIAKDGLYPIQYPDAYGQVTVCSILGSEDIDRQYLLGCEDGYIRRPNGSVYADDGDDIDSWIKFAPLRGGGGVIETIATELQATLADGSSGVTWYWHVGNSPDEVNAQDWTEAAASGEWTAGGFQIPVGLRETGGAHQLRLRQISDTETWAVEEIRAILEATGRRR